MSVINVIKRILWTSFCWLQISS